MSLRCWTCVETQYHGHGGPPTVTPGFCTTGPYLNFTQDSQECPPKQPFCYSRAVIKHSKPGKEWPAEVIQKSCKKAFWGGKKRELGCEIMTEYNLVYEHCLCDTDDCNKIIHDFEKNA
ncbi:unnamed protein product [Orchesella dallaii]|uniref:Protein sleepless n=1 Tax=Orchesella dallaii TaxID=48710 RepID=A0ABP1RQ11_9HEXA